MKFISRSVSSVLRENKSKEGANIFEIRKKSRLLAEDGEALQQLTRECFNRKGNNLGDGFCSFAPRQTICSHGSQRHMGSLFRSRLLVPRPSVHPTASSLTEGTSRRVATV